MMEPRGNPGLAGLASSSAWPSVNWTANAHPRPGNRSRSTQKRRHGRRRCR